jgi:hypothetical protein
VVPLLLEASQGSLELEWPEEVVRLLEVWADAQDLMNKVFDANYIMFTQTLIIRTTNRSESSQSGIWRYKMHRQPRIANLLDNFVVGQRNPLLVELPITPLVDQLPNTLQVWVPTKRKIL